jgi:hypothetical protein
MGPAEAITLKAKVLMGCVYSCKSHSKKHCTVRTTQIIHAKFHPIRLCSDHSPAEMGFGTTRDLMRGGGQRIDWKAAMARREFQEKWF